jgi:murein DD-endopeptidase MepM/ murein hydrolase activator NlpD
MMNKAGKLRVSHWLKSMKRRVFCKRSIIILSDHDNTHVPFSSGLQVAIIAGVLGFAVWASYSTGSYMAAQQVLVEKDRKLVTTALENERIEAEFALLRRDLEKLASAQKGDLAQDAQMLVEQYADSGKPSEAIASAVKTVDGKTKVDYSVVFSRIEYLENRVKELQTTHNTMMREIKQATAGKIKEIEEAIAMTGVDKTKLVKQVEAQKLREQQRQERFGRITGANGRGGPFEPANLSLLQEREPELSYELKRAVNLADAMDAMPLAIPMNGSFRKTSGFGARIDPFNGRIAYHSGIDLAGPAGSKAHAANDGKVTIAGWKPAYGYMVEVDHGLGFATRYAHLKAISVAVGQAVKEGEVVGVQGSTGRSTGNHLHYEVRHYGRPMDPTNFLKAGSHVRAIQ